MLTEHQINFDLTTFATQLGWSVAGVTRPEISETNQSYFDHWLVTHKGPGMKYLESRKIERKDPKIYFPEVRSILCFGLYYFQGWAEGDSKISNYAWGTDYHERLKELLENTASQLKGVFGEFKYKSSVDTAPLLEKPLAVDAGLGWQGKNTLLLNSKFGSYLFLGELLTDIPLARFQANLAVGDHCGTCTRCIDACPTKALKPYELDAHKCISYWTLEHKGAFDESTPPFHHWIAGCDICQEVCPWNQKLIALPQKGDESHFKNIMREEILSPEWPERLEGRALDYLPHENWKRNLDHLDAERLKASESNCLRIEPSAS